MGLRMTYSAGAPREVVISAILASSDRSHKHPRRQHAATDDRMLFGRPAHNQKSTRSQQVTNMYWTDVL